MYKGEYFNSISHLAAAVAALIGATVLITLAAVDGDLLKIICYTIYGVTLVLLYLSSTLFHSFQGQFKDLFQRLDHFSIYLLIAGTYTPFALVVIRGTEGWTLLSAVWGLAVLGIIIDSLPNRGARVIPLIIYLVMGWACVFTLDSMIAGMSTTAFYFLIAGGLIYSVGVIFFVLDNWYPWCHNVWHIFVIGGSVCHYIAIFLL